MARGGRPDGRRGRSTPAPQTLAGLTVVITGSVEGFTRDGATAAVTTRGGKVASSVSKKTDFVVVGENAGTKADRAIALARPVLDAAGFAVLLDAARRPAGRSGGRRRRRRRR